MIWEERHCNEGGSSELWGTAMGGGAGVMRTRSLMKRRSRKGMERTFMWRMFIHSNIFEHQLCARHSSGTWDPSVYVASQTNYKSVIVERVTASQVQSASSPSPLTQGGA